MKEKLQLELAGAYWQVLLVGLVVIYKACLYCFSAKALQ